MMGLRINHYHTCAAQTSASSDLTSGGDPGSGNNDVTMVSMEGWGSARFVCLLLALNLHIKLSFTCPDGSLQSSYSQAMLPLL